MPIATNLPIERNRLTMLGIPSGQSVSVIVGGHVLRVTPVFVEMQTGRFASVDTAYAVWSVKLECDGRRATIEYCVGEGNKDCDGTLDFGAFAECVVGDHRAASMELVDFVSEFGYTPDTGRKVWMGCRSVRDKLNRVLSLRFVDFAYCADYNLWFT